MPDTASLSDSEDTDSAHLRKIKPMSEWLKPIPKKDMPETLEPDWTGKKKLIDLVNPEGHRLIPDVSKPLPLGGPPGQVTIQLQFFFNKDLEYLVSGDKGRRSTLSISKLKAAQYLDFGLEELVLSLWIKSERDKVKSHMRILSVVSLKTYERYGYLWFLLLNGSLQPIKDDSLDYPFLREIVLSRADYKEYKISKAGFKNLHPNDFEDMYPLHLQGQLNHLSGDDKVYLLNAVNLLDASDFLFKEDYTIVSKPRAIIYKDRNDQMKMMRETEVHKFSDGTLQRILDTLDHMVKDFKLYEYNKGMETRIWSEDDRRRSKAFMEVIERRLKIRRIFKSLKSFVGGRLRDVDYKLIQRTK
ncbi:hypothetical protein Tco_0180106 [Tanacetum coccineum]